MKITLALFTLLLTAFSFNAFAQVTVSSNKVVYQRKGADLPEWKKEFEVNYPVFSGNIGDDVKRRLEQTFSYWRVFETSLGAETSDQWLYSLDYKVNYNQQGILELELFRSGVGAYPTVYNATIVADLDTGNQIKIVDAFQNRIGLLTMIDDAQATEMAVAVKKSEEGEAEYLRGKFKETHKASDEVKEFSVSDRGVTFIFEYDFPHASKASQPEGRYLILWDRLKPFLREYGKLATIGKPRVSEVKTVPLIELRIGGLLGGVREGQFVDGMTALKELSMQNSFVVFGPVNSDLDMSVDKYNARWKVNLAKEQPDDICPDFRYVEATPTAKAGVAIGNGADWNPVPNRVEEISNENPVYRTAVSNFLKTKGFDNPTVKIEQMYKVDLDGDGTDEIVIRAENYKYSENEMTADKGGYSFVLVRKIVNGTVKDILLTGDFIDDAFPGAENKHEVSSILDLNGDGKMEIVVFGEYYEGAWVAVYSVDGGNAKVVLETGCGV